VVWYDSNSTKSRDYIAHLDGYTVIPGGWVNRNYIQLAYQLSDSVTGFAYSFVGSCIILLVMNFIPGLSLRSSEDDEIMGIDDAEIGEFAVRLFFFPLPFLSIKPPNLAQLLH
jgi:ammonia channel protein AmtB